MAKTKVIDPHGLRHDGNNHAEGAEVELTGPFLEAALRFKQVEVVKEKPAKKGDKEAEEKTDPKEDGKKSDDKK